MVSKGTPQGAPGSWDGVVEVCRSGHEPGVACARRCSDGHGARDRRRTVLRDADAGRGGDGSAASRALTASRTVDPAVLDAALHDSQPVVRQAAQGNPHVTAEALERFREAERARFVEQAREFGGRRGGVVYEIQVDWNTVSMSEVDDLIAARRIGRQQLARAEAIYGLEARRTWEALRDAGDARARGLLNAVGAFNAREWPLGLRAKVTPVGIGFTVPHGDGARLAPLHVPFPEGATKTELTQAWDGGYRRAVLWASCPPVERWPAAERAHLAKVRRYRDMMAGVPDAERFASAWEEAARGERPIPATGFPALDPATVTERDWGAQVASGLATNADLRGYNVALRHQMETAAARGNRAARVHADRLRHWAGQGDLAGRTTLRREEGGRMVVAVTKPGGGHVVVARIPVSGKPTPLRRAWGDAIVAARAALAAESTGTMAEAA